MHCVQSHKRRDSSVTGGLQCPEQSLADGSGLPHLVSYMSLHAQRSCVWAEAPGPILLFYSKLMCAGSLSPLGLDLSFHLRAFLSLLCQPDLFQLSFVLSSVLPADFYQWLLLALLIPVGLVFLFFTCFFTLQSLITDEEAHLLRLFQGYVCLLAFKITTIERKLWPWLAVTPLYL